MATGNGSDDKLRYFETHLVPYELQHMQMRSVGLQIFTAIQGGLFIGWAKTEHPALILLGFGSAIALVLWEARNRWVFRRIREFGEEYVDRKLFGVGADGEAVAGWHKLLIDEIDRSGKLWPPKNWASHSGSIRVLIIVSLVAWAAAFTTLLQTEQNAEGAGIMALSLNTVFSGIIGAFIACLFMAFLQRANEKHQQKMQKQQFEHEKEMARLRQRKEDDAARTSRNMQKSGTPGLDKIGGTI